MSGVYFHVPFCKQACNYCNFHFSTSARYQDEMIEAMSKELNLKNGFLPSDTLDSVYFGGGTPSILNEEHLKLLINKLNEYYKLSFDAEVTLEANPDDITKDKLRSWKKLGINRLSIGIQSFFEDELKWMNRAHHAEEAQKCIQLAQDAGFNNITIDLIFGLPISNHERWKENLMKAVDFDVPHISAYALTVEPGTALSHFIQKGKEKEAPDDYTMEQFDITHDLLTSAGFDHYEISNYGKPDFKAVHNSNYWKSKPYLGIGPSAHSYDGKVRRWNIAHNPKYMKALKEGRVKEEVEEIDADTRYNEYVMTRIRTTWGVKIKDIHSMGENYLQHFMKHIPALEKRQWISAQDNHYLLTKKGMHFADAVAMELFI